MKFISKMIAWMSKSHKELTTDTPYEADEVWDMILECLEKIFEELNMARVSVVDAA